MVGALLVGAPTVGSTQEPRPRPQPPPAPVDSQPPRPVGDSARAPAVPLPAVDTVPRDTIKAPFAVAERPRQPEFDGARVRWDREEIFSSGALTLAELLATQPGLRIGSAGFMNATTAAHWYGQPGRVRAFVDGVEWDALDPRGGGSLDLATIPLWPMEEVSVERAAGELRVYLRSWRVERTEAETRTDVYTGSENTNLYRGYYGKRLQSGLGLQIAAQQYSTANLNTGGNGDALGAFARVGVARGDWSVDASALRLRRTRELTRRFITKPTPVDDAIPRYNGRDIAASVRAGYRSADSAGVWATLTAATIQYVEDDSVARSGAAANADSLVSQSQWIATLGVNRGAWQTSATVRLRAQAGETRLAPALRASWMGARAALSGSAESAGPDSTLRLDFAARLRVLRWLHLGAYASQHTPTDAVVDGPARLTTRAQLGLVFADRWLTVAAIQRSEARVIGLAAFDSAYGPATLPAASGIEVGLRGTIIGPLSLAWSGISWGAEEAIYRSSLESHTELRVETALRKSLPRADFRLIVAVTHDYQNDYLAPDGVGGVMRAKGASALGTLLDIRIKDAHVFWYNRNLTGKVYETVPGYLMPRLMQLYGIRWRFWN